MSGLPAAARELPPIWPMYRALVGVGLLCGLLIVSVFEITRPIIARNREEALQRAIVQVLPGTRSTLSFREVARGGFLPLETPSEGAALVHAGFDAEGRLLGVALEAQAMGYQDVIRLLYGYAFDEQAIIGIRVLESRETPGLGDRIETDPRFLANFERLSVPLGEDDGRVLHPIEAVKSGAKEHPWQIDGITGATISSAAVAEALRRSTTSRIPRVHAARGDFRAGG